jgi:cytochrome b561
MGYGDVSRIFHWATVILVSIMIPVGLVMTQDIAKETQDTLFVLHKGLGPIVLVVVALRLAWRLFHPPPPLPASVPPLQARIAGIVHWGLYALLLTMAISGYVRVTTGGFPLELLNALGIPPLFPKNEWIAGVAKAVHATAIFGLMALIAMHVGAAAYHGIVKKDGVVGRMWPPLRPRG